MEDILFDAMSMELFVECALDLKELQCKQNTYLSESDDDEYEDDDLDDDEAYLFSDDDEDDEEISVDYDDDEEVEEFKL